MESIIKIFIILFFLTSFSCIKEKRKKDIIPESIVFKVDSINCSEQYKDFVSIRGIVDFYNRDTILCYAKVIDTKSVLITQLNMHANKGTWGKTINEGIKKFKWVPLKKGRNIFSFSFSSSYVNEVDSFQTFFEVNTPSGLDTFNVKIHNCMYKR